MMSEDNFYFRDTCRLCTSSDLERVIELTPTPPGNDFLREDELGRIEPVYPLEVYFCKNCHHLQLGHVVNPSVLFRKEYSFVSGTSPVNVKHFEDYAAETIERFKLPEGSLVGDIGSNDGTCLRPFQKAGMKVLGVDPASNIAKIASDSGIPTVDDFFDRDLAQKLRSEHGPADLITTHNVCAHIDDLESVIHGVREWLADDGLFIMEVGYLLDVFTNVWFDTIYHEHVDFHTVAPLVKFFDRMGLEIISAERTAPQGGSVRMVSQKKGANRKRDTTVSDLIELEREAGLDRPETFASYSQKINIIGENLRQIIQTLKDEGKSIAAFGAPTKATTLLSHFGLGAAELDFLIDDNPLKQGLYSPGSNIPVLPAEELYQRRPDYLLILAWNFAEPIMAKHRTYAEEGGHFILPMPEARIVRHNNS